jgi:hypothetical protein
VHEWEAAREIGGKNLEVPSIREALEKYFDDAEARHLEGVRNFVCEA